MSIDFIDRLNSYKLVLMVAVTVSVQVFLVLAAREGLPAITALVVCLFLLVGAIGGARLLFIFENRSRSDPQPMKAWKYGAPGAASFGGVLGAVAVAVSQAPFLDLPLPRLLDLLAISGMPGLAIGRVGCLLKGCCPGRKLRVSQHILGDTPEASLERRVPVQLFEIPGVLGAWSFTLIVFAVARESGVTFFCGATAYSVVRLCTDNVRDLPRGRHGLTRSQLLALAFGALGALGIVTTTSL